MVNRLPLIGLRNGFGDLGPLVRVRLATPGRGRFFAVAAAAVAALVGGCGVPKLPAARLNARWSLWSCRRVGLYAERWNWEWRLSGGRLTNRRI